MEATPMLHASGPQLPQRELGSRLVASRLGQARGHRLGPEPGPMVPGWGLMVPVVPAALLGGPAFGSLAGDSPWLGPLFPVVLPFIELPVVVELAAWPPAAELPPALEPAPEPPLWAKALVERASTGC
jgi:hypothetical protein